jgi:predicted phosphate transport protein (TIGR00153 family)
VPVRLIPKDEGFFELFDSLAVKMTKSSALLDELFNEPNRLHHFAAEIKKIEHEADDITHEIMNRIDRSFVTPLDREDIHLLATRLDTVVDLMDGTARRATMFHLADRREPAKQLTNVLMRATHLIARAVKELKNPSVVATIGREIKLLEEEGDALYSAAVGALFEGTPDALDVIKWKELYDNIEHAIDECEDVLNVLESISLKNS